MSRRLFRFRFPTEIPMRRQGITAPSLAMVTPENPALHPERVSPQSAGGTSSLSVPARGSPEITAKSGPLRDRALS